MATLRYVHCITQWLLECGLSPCVEFLNDITDGAVLWEKVTAHICMRVFRMWRLEFCYLQRFPKEGSRELTFTVLLDGLGFTQNR